MRPRFAILVVAIAAITCVVLAVDQLGDQSDASAEVAELTQAKQQSEPTSGLGSGATRMVGSVERDEPTEESERSAADPTTSLSVSRPTNIDSSELHVALGNEEAVNAPPFSPSPSVLAGCSATDTCDHELGLLREFETEMRDPAWAQGAEDALRNFMVGDATYTIRQLLCRTSTCVIEVASTAGPHFGITYQQEKSAGLHKRNALFGYERDENGTRVTVTLRLYQRK